MFNTGNPVPSNDPRDRDDNTVVLDSVINGILDRYINRKGESLTSIRGMMKIFNEKMASVGYDMPVPYAPGITIDSYTQLIEKDGEFYKAGAGSIPLTTTGDWSVDSESLVSVGDAVLRQELSVGDGSMVSTTTPLAGAVNRTILNGLGLDFISVRAFGAICDGGTHPLSERYSSVAQAQLHFPLAQIESLDQTIDWAAHQNGVRACAAVGRRIDFGGGEAVMSDTIELPAHLRCDADGPGEWLAWTPVFQKKQAPCQWRFIGTGKKKWSMPLVSDNRTAGGVLANPSSRDSNDTHYRLTSFKNEDGTDRLFSVAVKTERSANGVQLANIRIVPDCDGIAGYNDTSRTTLGADWDFGLWNESCQNFIAYNVHAVGYWRMGGSLQTAVINNDDAVSGSGKTGSEYSRYQYCNFQGGTLIRGGDTYRVTGVGPGYIEIENASNLPFHAAPTGRLRAGGSETSAAIFSYSSVAVSGDSLRIYVNESTASVAIGGVLVANVHGFGISNTVYQDCEMSPLSHASGKRATELGMSKPSCGIEISGSFIRGVEFRSSKVIGHDDVAIHMHNAADVLMTGQFVIESKPDSTTGTVGMRVLASPAPANNTRVPNPMGQTDRVRIDYGSSTTNPAPDFRPYSKLAAPGRFNGAGDTGFFSPQSLRWMDKQHPMDRLNSILTAPGGGSVLLRDQDGATRVQVSADVTLRDSSGSAIVTVNGAGSQVSISAGGTGQVFLSSGIRPLSDGGAIIGSNSFRYKDIYLMNSPTVTSDERQKIDIVAVREAAMDAWESVGYYEYKNIHAVDEKGSDARRHFGLIAQRVKKCFEDFGVDPFEFGILCYAEWDEFEAVYTGDHESDSDPIKLADARPAGDVLMIRYEEAACLEAATQRRRADRIEERLNRLESFLK